MGLIGVFVKVYGGFVKITPIINFKMATNLKRKKKTLI